QIFNDDGFDVGWAFGDPHLVTLDGLGYDFMAVGEFVLIETLPEATNPFQVQVRYEPYPGSEVVSIATRMAVKVGDRRIELRLGEDPLLVDGFAVPIDSIPGGLDINGDGRLDLTKDTSKDNRYILFLNDLGEQVVVDIYDSFMDVNVLVSQDRDGAVRGLLGDSDGNPDNDLRGRDGTLYSQPIAFTDLYGAFADSWRVDTVGTGNNKDSLFSYDVDEGVGSFNRNDFPSGSIDLTLVPPDLLAKATTAVEAAGITNPVLRQAAIYDYFLTGDGAFLNSAANSPSIPTTSGTLDTNSIPVIASVGVTAEQPSVMEGESGSSKTLTFRFWRTD
ncbi:MAG: VWD domain-containing protein, partial [Microcystaceae cyanobacterium]